MKWEPSMQLLHAIFVGPGSRQIFGVRHPELAVGFVAATAMGLLGIAAAYFVYVQSPGLPERLAERWQTAHRLSFNKWYFDEAYDRTVVRPTFLVAGGLWSKVDVALIDGAVNGIARAFAWTGWLMRLVQTGQAQNYALAMTAGAVVILTVYLFL